MTAEEMFEELGFYQQTLDKSFIGKHLMYSNGGCDTVIQFYFNEKEVAIDTLTDNKKRYVEDYKLYKAIQKQCEELGWE